MNCSICQKPIDIQANGWKKGHNAFPLTEGKCCTTCNDNEVIPMRIAFLQMGRPMPTQALTSVVKEQQKARAISDVSLKHKISFIIKCEKQHNNSWRWINKASSKEINDLFDYWTQEQ
mgnify:FL=1|tara:strand:- start:1443 stop:1796 length:354 start_codon:yes stop_codon:yes gene_type:complete